MTTSTVSQKQIPIGESLTVVLDRRGHDARVLKHLPRRNYLLELTNPTGWRRLWPRVRTRYA